VEHQEKWVQLQRYFGITLSHILTARRLKHMNARSERIEHTSVQAGTLDFAEVFRTYYPRIARVIARIVQDPGRAEELASEVFWKFWRNPNVPASSTRSWLYRTAVRMGIDELRRRHRRGRFEKFLDRIRTSPSPEQVLAGEQDQQQVRRVLASLKVRDSELLVLRSEGLSYLEVAEILRLNETSIGTLLRRAQQAFRKEYVKRYGQPNR
jgi:RNA polymerase sigma-70 factor, ECF subfamily